MRHFETRKRVRFRLPAGHRMESLVSKKLITKELLVVHGLTPGLVAVRHRVGVSHVPVHWKERVVRYSRIVRTNPDFLPIPRKRRAWIGFGSSVEVWREMADSVSRGEILVAAREDAKVG